MKEIETSKGRFVVIDDKKETHYPFHMYIQLYGDNYYKLSEITELEASEIVDYIPFNYRDKDYKLFRDYKLSVGNYCGRLSAIHSLYSLLESQGIEITNNTYIFKV